MTSPALEIYRAAVQRWPNVKITLRNRARVIEQSWDYTRRSLHRSSLGWLSSLSPSAKA